MTSKQALIKICNYKLKTDINGFNWTVGLEFIDEYGIIKNDLEVLECFKKYFNFELVFENNQTFLIFKSKERYLPVDEKILVANKYYEPLKDWLKK